ncbi:T6SS effector BTH_I2691 family protein [Burkholderia cepacia]|uniref:T6SS effector BTH_I2691 family protein n=1 Tax=Burkholderia cepacia TaxID=292 RepID=UPI0007C78B7C|nr:T6SS effector BTH_I2691 family protein [Burkholderia cepacia]
MSTSTSLGSAIKQAAPNPTGSCNACQRTGLPILPLRAAYAPAPGSTRERKSSADSEVKSIPMRLDQPRTLRQGYLYVLLDKKVWQAYQVTPEGALRQFRAYQPPREKPSSLSKSCIDQDHDAPASFINIDTSKYKTAWIAIANDPWPKKVLDQYRRGTADDGTALESRFYKLDLKAARDNPASVGIAMTEGNLNIHHVLEYAEVNSGDFNSVHGFYTRNHRMGALNSHIRTLVQREKLQKGVLALVLPDPIGLVQECNAQRVNWVRVMQEWRAQPQRRFELFTSQALLGIKELRDAWAAAEAAEEAKAEDEYRRKWNNSPIAAKAALPPVDIKAETERRTKSKKAEARKRLEERYDEGARAKFKKAYLAELDTWQQAIDQVGEQYAREYQAAPFQLAARHDYNVTSLGSVEDFIRMMSLCLHGGPTEVIEKESKKKGQKENKKESAPLGPTQRLWKAQLEDRKSLFYQALLAMDQTLLDQLQTALAGDDLGKVYGTIKTVIGTEEGKKLMVAPVQQAIGQLLAAAANASNTLTKQLSAQTQALVGHIHSAAFLRYAGQHVTQVVVSLKIGEYLTMLNEALQERTDQFIVQLDQKFRKPAERKIRAMVLSGTMAIAVSGNHGKMVDVMLWSLESAESLQARLEKLRVNAGVGVAGAVRAVSIGAATLQHGAAQMKRSLSIGADSARALAKGAMQRMRNAATSLGPGRADLLLSLGSLWFQQDSLRKSYEAFVKTPGSGNPEALAAVWSSSIGVMGVGVEVVGVSTQILRPELTTTIKVAGQAKTVMWGARIAQYGGAIAAVTGVMDSAQYFFAAGRVSRQGDDSSKKAYQAAGTLALLSVFPGVAGSMAAGSFLLGPVGIAVILGLSAYAIAMWAKRLESSALELWARHSLWGTPETHRQWHRAEDLDTAIGALNAAVLGMTAELSITIRFHTTGGGRTVGPAGVLISDGTSVPAGFYLDYRIDLPNHDPTASRYEWSLIVYRPGNSAGQKLAAGHSDSNQKMAEQPPSGMKVDYNPNTTMPTIEQDAATNTLTIRGAIALDDSHSIHAAELNVSYWPDKSDEDGYARLIAKEDKMDRSKKGGPR